MKESEKQVIYLNEKYKDIPFPRITVLKDFKYNDSVIYLSHSYFLPGACLKNNAGFKILLMSHATEVLENTFQYITSAKSDEWFYAHKGDTLIDVPENFNRELSKMYSKKHEYGGNTKSFIEKEMIEPLYLEEELVPSQFFGLNDYLNCRI